MNISRAVVLAAVTGALAAAAPATQAADVAPTAPNTAPVATVANRTPIAAGGGWVLWSEKTGDAWALTGRHDGQVAGLPVATRDAPFDVTIGTGANGEAVAVYTRCAGAPVESALLDAGIVLPGISRPGCRVSALDLATGQETTPAIPRPTGSTDTAPAIHGGRIAFARLATANAAVPQILLWSPKRPGRLTKLAGGALPARAAGGSATVRGLAFNGTRVAYLWQPSGPGVEGNAAWELRSAPASGARSRLLDVAILGEACTGPSRLLSRPIFLGNAPAWVQVTDDCYAEAAKLITQLGHHRRAGAVAGALLDLAGDASAQFGLFGVERSEPGENQGFPTCSPACEIRPLTVALHPVRTARVSSPFA